MGDALLWGLVAGSAFVLGGVLRLVSDLSDRWLGLLLGFGAGALLSAVAYELIEGAALAAGGSGRVAAGLALGAILSYMVTMRAHYTERSSGALLVSIAVSAVPEAVIIVGSLLLGHGVDVAVVAAVALCSFPEAVAATGRLVRYGNPKGRILAIWVGMWLLVGISAAIGYTLLDGAAPTAMAFVLALAGGAVLTQLVAVMIPESHSLGGPATGMAAVLGFALSAALVGVG